MNSNMEDQRKLKIKKNINSSNNPANKNTANNVDKSNENQNHLSRKILIYINI